VIAIEPSAEAQRLECERGPRNDGCRRIKGDDVSNRGGGGRAAKRAILEMRVRGRVVVPVMRKILRRVRSGAELQQKRRSARRHETDRYVGPKQQRRQQQAAE